MRKLYLRDEKTGEEVEIGPVVGLSVDAESPSLVKLALKTRVPFRVVQELIAVFGEGYHPGLSKSGEPE